MPLLDTLLVKCGFQTGWCSEVPGECGQKWILGSRPLNQNLGTRLTQLHKNEVYQMLLMITAVWESLEGYSLLPTPGAITVDSIEQSSADLQAQVFPDTVPKTLTHGRLGCILFPSVSQPSKGKCRHDKEVEREKQKK